MKNSFLRDSLGLLFNSLLFMLPLKGHAESADDLKLIPLHNGTNNVNLDGAGLSATVVIARRDNFNAHSIEVSTIYVTLKAVGYDDAELKIVPIERGEGGELLQLTTGGGADCLLHDYRLLADPVHRSAVLIIADRKFGDNFADPQPVTFEYYQLTHNLEGAVGSPALYFRFQRKQISKKPYCDVNEAFKAELSIPADKGQQLP